MKSLCVKDVSIAEIRQELRARDVADSYHVQKQLKLFMLQGVQQVPSFLVPKPDRKLSNLNLQHYIVRHYKLQK